MSEQKIIYIMGADFSGTTLLDFMMGSTDFTASLGELASFIYPTSSAHLEPRCSCGEQCGIWKKKHFDQDPYDYLFARHGVSCLIDSSKQIGWVLSQSRRAQRKGRKVFVVVIWKDSKSYADSCANRGNSTRWATKWIGYYKALLQSGLKFYSISLSDLLTDTETSLKGICEYSGIQYFPGMCDYAQYKHHTVFGSATARIKLYAKGSESWLAERNNSLRADFHNKSGKKPVEPTALQSKQIAQITSILGPSGSKSSGLVKGHSAVWLTITKNSIARTIYFLGFEPSKIIRRICTFL